MRDNLIGYLLDALEPAEQELVEARLASDPAFRREMEVLSRSLSPLEADKAHFEPPVGLAHRTCQFVAAQVETAPSPPVTSVSSRWSMADLAMAAGIFLAATLLFWPAMNQSRFAARLAGCQDNLRQLGMALGTYSTQFPGQFPAAAMSGHLNRAGTYAVILQEQGYVPKTHVLVCPASELADRMDAFRVPTSRELIEAQAERLHQMWRRMGGSYGYSLGFVVDGRYQPPRDLRRATQALMADAPSPTMPNRRSLNHGGRGQNVLFEDLHVKYLTTCTADGCQDLIFVNDEGQPRAGLHEADAVIGASDDSPLEGPMVPNEILLPAR